MGFLKSTLADNLLIRYTHDLPQLCHELYDEVEKDHGTFDAQTVYLHRQNFQNCYKDADEDMRYYLHRLDEQKRELADGG